MRRTVMTMRVLIAVIIAAAAGWSAHSPLVAVGLAAAMYIGHRFGSWFALMALGEFERSQRTWRVRNWRRGGGG